MNRFLFTALASSGLALAPLVAGAADEADSQVFARCADTLRPIAEVDIRVKGIAYRPLSASGIVERLDRATNRITVLQDGAELATITQDAKTVTIRGGWASYAEHDVDGARLYRTVDPTCAPDQRTLTFKKPVIPSD
jgi:hypothetical protein